MSFLDVFKAKQFKEENENLKKFVDSIGGTDALAVNNAIQELEKKLAQLEETVESRNQEIAKLEEYFVNKRKREIDQLESELAEKQTLIDQTVITRTQEILNLDREIEEKGRQLLVAEEEILLETFALYKPKFSFQSSEQYKHRLDTVRQKQKELIKQGKAAYGSQTWTVNNNKTEGKKMVNNMSKLVLRAFNNECDYCVDHVKFNNIEASEKRILQSFDALNKLGQIMQVCISNEYKNSKLEELYLAFEYQRKKQDEKEEQKRAREELREQQKLEREIRVARERILKEKKHFESAITDLENRLVVASEVEKSLIAEKLEDMRQKKLALDNEEKIVDYREQNAKAGYVYVISNVGAFGSDIYKIGMTRRLEPMDRVDELGDASVPFSFDVHALIFSENAPELESKLHQHFRNTRLNKLNNRKEFFRADIHEIEAVIRQNYDKVVDVVKEAAAEQYRESLKI